MTRTRIYLASVGALALLIGATVSPVGAQNVNQMRQLLRRAPNVQQSLKINANGKVQLMGAVVTAVSPNGNGSGTLAADIEWGNYVQHWTIEVNNGTSMVRRFNGRSSFGEIAVGDTLNVSGRLNTNATTATLRAENIKNWSIEKPRTVVRGTIESIDTQNSRLTVRMPDGTAVTVLISSSTTLTRDGVTVSLSSIVVGDRIASSAGTYNNTTRTLQATEVRVASTGNATPTPTLSISNVTVTNIQARAAQVRWTTNVASNSRVYVSTSTPVNLAAAAQTSSTSLVTDHRLLVTDLSPDTRYYVVVESATSAGVTRRAAEISFRTQ